MANLKGKKPTADIQAAKQLNSLSIAIDNSTPPH